MDVKNIENCTPVMVQTTLQINIDPQGVLASFEFVGVVEELKFCFFFETDIEVL